MKEKRFVVISVIFILLSCLAGCASIDYRAKYYADGVSRPGIYPGVREDIDALSGYNGDFMGMLPEWFYDAVTILDLPFSFAVDTLCMPYDLFRNWERNVYVKGTGFDKLNSTASFEVKNILDKTFSAKAVIVVQETWRPDLSSHALRWQNIGSKTTNIIIPPKAKTGFNETIECSPTGIKHRSFRARVSLGGYKEVK